VFCVDLGGLNVKGEIILTLFDVSGRVVGQWQERTTPGQSQVSIPLQPGLAAGVFVLEIRVGEGFRVQRLKVIYLP
jgi:hypothetical protein